MEIEELAELLKETEPQHAAFERVAPKRESSSPTRRRR